MHERCLLTLIGLCSLLCACSGPYREQAITPIRITHNVQETWDQSHRYFIGFPTPEAFSVCHDLSCHRVSDLSLSAAEWQQVADIFQPDATTAAEERQQIARAIALLERLIGIKAGTSHDLGENELRGSRVGQLDCVDEATNTSVYLRMLDNQGLLKWHQAAPRTARGVLSGLAPHNTASIVETGSGRRYAVDAWFFANGMPPAIVQLDLWKDGWRPQQLTH